MESTTRTNEPTIIATDSLSSLLEAQRWTRNPKTRLLNNSKNHIKLIWLHSHVVISGNKAADQSLKDDLNEEIGNQELSSPQDLMKGMNKMSSITDKKDGKEVKTI
jgi:hypothetical protein